MNHKVKKYGRAGLAVFAVLIGFYFAESYLSFGAIFMSLLGAWVAIYVSGLAVEDAIDDFAKETGFSRFKIQQIRYGRKYARIKCYVTCLFITLGSAFFLSLIAASIIVENRIPQIGESQMNLFWKIFAVMIAPSFIGVRLQIGQQGIEDKCPHCKKVFSASKDPSYVPNGVVYDGNLEQHIVSCPTCGENVLVRGESFHDPNQETK